MTVNLSVSLVRVTKHLQQCVSFNLLPGLHRRETTKQMGSVTSDSDDSLGSQDAFDKRFLYNSIGLSGLLTAIISPEE
jgi:hypothetical protein